MERRVLRESGEILPYYFTRKNIKHLHLRIRDEGMIFVSAPLFIKTEQVDRFVLSRFDFIRQAQTWKQRQANYEEKRLAELEAEGFPKEGTAAHRQACQIYFQSFVHQVLPRFADCVSWQEQQHRGSGAQAGLMEPTVRVRRMRSRWGSCLPSGSKICLNTRLIAYPRACQESVIVHELCHFVHPNHSTDFYRLLTEKMPDWRRYKAVLDQRGGADGE